MMAQGGKRTGGQCHGAMARVMIRRNGGGGDWGKKTPDRWGPPVSNGEVIWCHVHLRCGSVGDVALDRRGEKWPEMPFQK
jgi:hypothetical protein